MAGIREIAREVGVSISTVSYALNGTRPISTVTRERILEAVQRLGYRPDVRGRNLGAMRAQVVGVVIPSLTAYYIAPLLAQIDRALVERGYRLLITHAGHQKDFNHLFEKGQVDGVIVVVSALADGGQELVSWVHQLCNREMPCVVINRSLPEMVCVQTDYTKGALLAMHHLIGLGHRKIGFVGEDAADPTQVALLSGYLQALKQHHLESNPAWIAKDSQTAFRQWMHRPTAVFVAGQYHTFAFYRQVRARHFHIPEDFAVVGFDDDTNEADLWPGLTTVAQPHHEVGKTSVALLMQEIHGDGLGEQKILIAPTLIIRESCGYSGSERIEQDSVLQQNFRG